MTTPYLNLLYGSSIINLAQDEILPTGATLRNYTMVSEGTNTTAPITLVSELDLGLVSAQSITVPSLKVNSSLKLPLIPDGVSGGTSSLVPVFAPFAPFNVLQLITLNDVVVGTENFVTNPDMVWNYTDSLGNHVINDPPTDPTGATGSFLMRVSVDIPASTVPVKNSIILAAGSPCPGTGILQDSVGNEINFSVLPDIATQVGGSYVFINPFDLKGYVLTSDITSYNVTFAANHHIPTGTTLSIAAINVPSSNMTYGGGIPKDLIIPIVFAPATVFGETLTLSAGTFIGSGNVIPSGSEFSNNSPDVGIAFDNVILGRGYTVPAGSNLYDVNPTDQVVQVVKGSATVYNQNLPIGTSICDRLHLGSGTVFPQGYVLEGDLQIECSLTTNSNVTLEEGSVITKGSVLPPGSPSIDGLISNTSVTIPTGTQFQNAFKLPFDLAIPAVSVPAATTNLSAGTKMKKGTVLTSTTQIPSGFVTPGNLKIDYTSGAYLATGTTLPPGTSFYSNFHLRGATSFQAGLSFPKGFVFPVGTKFPTKTKFGSGSVFAFPFQVPEKTEFCPGTILPVGTTFSPGAKIPIDVDFIANDATNSANVNLFDVLTIDSVDYAMIPSGSVFLRGKIIPAGSFLSTQVNGTTTALNFQTGTASSGISLSQNDYQYENCSPGQGQFLIESTNGDPPLPATQVPIRLLTGVQLPTDILVPLQFFPEPLAYVTLSSSLVLQIPTTLSHSYCVTGFGPVLWPANVATPTTWTISSDFNVSSAFMSTKVISLPCGPTSEYYNDIIPSTASLIFPASTTVLNGSIILGATIGISSVTSSGGSNVSPSFYGSLAYLQLIPETLLVLATTAVGSNPTYITITGSSGNLTALEDFILAVSIQIYGATTLLKSTIFPVNSYALAPITIASGNRLPEGFTLPSAVTVCNDFVAGNSTDNPVTLIPNTIIAAGSIFKKGTSFPDGLTLLSEAIIYHIVSLQNTFTFPRTQSTCGEFEFPQFAPEVQGSTEIPFHFYPPIRSGETEKVNALIRHFRQLQCDLGYVKK
jgi:hypothetical protein